VNFKIDTTAKHISGITNNGFGIVWGKQGTTAIIFESLPMDILGSAKPLTENLLISVDGRKAVKSIKKNFDKENHYETNCRGCFFYTGAG